MRRHSRDRINTDAPYRGISIAPLRSSWFVSYCGATRSEHDSTNTWSTRWTRVRFPASPPLDINTIYVILLIMKAVDSSSNGSELAKEVIDDISLENGIKFWFPEGSDEEFRKFSSMGESNEVARSPILFVRCYCKESILDLVAKAGRYDQ